MDAVSTFFAQYGLDFHVLLKSLVLIIFCTFLVSAVGRFIFGKKSTLVTAVSSAIGILFVYALNIVLRTAGAEFQEFIAPLPFISIAGDTLTLFHFTGADYTVICTEVLSLIILAFLMNLIDRIIPKGKNIFTGILFRAITVILAQAGFLVIHYLMALFLPMGFLVYAPAIVLAILVLMLLTGCLKLVVGLFLATVNPVIAALYTFFFANIVGKMITRAVLTTAILCGLVYAMEYIGITTICIAAQALIAYIPFVLILLLLWYWIPKIFH